MSNDLVLSTGLFSEYPCGSRMLNTFLYMLLVFSALAVVAFGIDRLFHRFTPIAESGSELVLDRVAKFSIYALVASFVITIAVAMTLSRSPTDRIVTETKLIEKGCRFGSEYEVVYNIAEIRAK